jgi:hypothetical protein
MNNTLEIKCKLLITSVLNEIWEDVICKLSKNEIIIFYCNSYFKPFDNRARLGNSSKQILHNKLEKTSILPIINIITIIKDPDNLSIRIDSRSINQGYYQIKFDRLDYLTFLSYLEQFKNIEFQYRTKEQDKIYK